MNKIFASLVLAALTLPALNAFAGPVFEKSISDQSNMERSPQVEFMVNNQNPELKRAWVHVSYNQATLMDSDSGLASSSDIVVPNLSYSAASKEIIYTKPNGSQVVCATQVEKSFFKGLSYHDTGKCVLGLQKTTLTQDDGFYVKKSQGLNVTLTLQD